MFDVFVPMMSLFHMGRRPRYMAKAEMAKWPLIGKWFQLVGMQPVQRHSGKAKQIEETSIDILTSGRPLTVWPEGTVTRDCLLYTSQGRFQPVDFLRIGLLQAAELDDRALHDS